MVLSPSRDVDGEDLLDDALTAPSNHMDKGHAPSNDDDQVSVNIVMDL